MKTALLLAQLLTFTPEGVFVAKEGTFITSNEEQVVVLDALRNEAAITDLATDITTRIETAETPIAAAFVGRELYILARDARVLQHGTTRIPLSADPSFLRVANGKLYVYARAAGVIEEVENDRVTRRLQIAPFASDFEISGDTAYLVYPRDGRIRTADLATMKIGDELAVGAVPSDLAFAGGGTALTARILAVADASAKRVWMAEGTQSMGAAIARGFLRGFLGLGLFGNRASQFPTGVDRVEIRGKHWVAYDSSSRTLYHFTKKRSSVIATNVAPGGWTLTDQGVAWWNGTSVAQKKLQ